MATTAASPMAGTAVPTIPAPIAMTMGEPAGIGIEIALKTWRRRSVYDLPPFYLIADPDHVRATLAALEKLDRSQRIRLAMTEITTPGETAGCFDQALPVFPQALAAMPEPGKLNKANAGAVLSAIEVAVAPSYSIEPLEFRM